MNARRFLWTLVIAALVTMAAMLMLERWGRKGAPEPAATGPAPKPPAAAPATSIAAAPTTPTAAAPTKPAEVKPATATAPARTRPAAADKRAKWRVEPHDVHEVLLGSQDQSTGYKFQVQLTSFGAAIKTVKLSEHFMTVADKHQHKRDPANYQKAVAEDPKLKGHYPVLNPVGSGRQTVYPLATRQVHFPSEGIGLLLYGPWWQAGEVKTDEDGTQSVTFTAQVDKNDKPYVRLEKTYTVRKGAYAYGVEVGLRAVNLSGREVKLDLWQFSTTGVPREDLRSDMRKLAYGKYAGNKLKVLKKPVSKMQETAPLEVSGNWREQAKKADLLGRSNVAEAVLWVGTTNKYFAALTYVVPPAGSKTLAAPEAAVSFHGAAVEETAATSEEPARLMALALMNLGPYRVPAGGAVEVKLDLFAGPKQRELFNKSPLYTSLKYKDSLDFGSCCTWAPLSLAMMWLLDLFSKVTLGNYGLAIILLVILVRLGLHPLTKKGQVSMMAMQKLQPEMQAAREKYKDNKAKLNEEMVKIYKSAGASPYLGCLPMLLQMPIWIALWTGLQAAVELRHAGLLPFWITDLAAPDALIDFGRTVFNFPMVGPVRSFNLLPLLLAVAMFVNQKFTPSTPTTTQQQGTQKQMMYFMTGFFLLIFYNAPSGLTMYIMASTFAGVFEQYVIRKHIRQRQAAEAAAETKVAMPGKRFRGQKPKKPKGPFRTIR